MKTTNYQQITTIFFNSEKAFLNYHKFKELILKPKGQSFSGWVAEMIAKELEGKKGVG